MNSLKKILIIGDIHIGQSRESTSHPGIIRQANTQAEETLKALIPRFRKEKFDLVVHTGDGLRDVYDKSVDSENLSKTLKLLQSINAPTIHLIGNHELHAFTLSELEDIYRHNDINPKFHGFIEYKNFNVLWLDLKLDQDKQAWLPKERFAFIDSISENKPLLAFSHYSLTPIDSDGSYYFHDDPEYMHYANADEIVKTLKNKNPALCINGHVHMISHNTVENTHYISAPSFTENITADKFPENNPGIYSMLKINNNKFTFTSTSGSSCFAKIQGSLVVS